MSRTVLVIDDEPDLLKLLDHALTREGYTVLTARNGAQGLSAARLHSPHAIILDVMMPGVDGFELCKHLRMDPATARIPVLLLTAKAEEHDRILGLELGADDYVTKPFSTRELMARVKALLRRMEAADEPSEVIRTGPLRIDAARRSVLLSGKPLALTTTEFNLLQALAQRPGRVLSREELISRARGEDVTVLDRTIDVHVAALRRKLGRRQDLIETVRGIGYRLKE
ncbi:MAG: response regulator transcription factor [Planctomycetes bacterium]|nr:response regulator transcription factor [Planctomycetota bacterium]